MANPAVESLKYNYVVIESPNGRKVDITNSVIFTDYFEDILSPFVTMSMMVMNTTSLVQMLPIRGGERVAISVQTYLGDLVLDKEYSMYVYKASDINPTDTNEYFTLHLTSREALTNETNRVMQRHSGNIKTTVEKILKNDLLTEKYDENNIEQTANSYEFLGNNRKPFTVLTWLCPKSLPTKKGGVSGGETTGKAKGVSGFCFWESRNGFNFKSVDTLVSSTSLGTADLKNIPEYTFTGVLQTNDTDTNVKKILRYDIEKNIDLLRSLRVGMYSNFTYFFDIYTGSMDYYSYDLVEELSSKLGTESQISVPEGFKDRPSRVMTRVSDRGVLDIEGVRADSGRDIADVAKSTSRYNLLFSQSLNMTVPCNVNLKAGDVIRAIFPAVEMTNQKQPDANQSGNYLIKELRHHFELNQNVTSLKLVRDSYGLYGSNIN